MPHIHDLHRDVLEKILYKAVAAPAKNLSEWKIKLPLLAVCRKWTKLALSFVFYQVFVELPRFPDSNSYAHFLWTSNAGLFISRRCVLRALRLTIQLPYNVTPDHIRIIALDILMLDRVDWQNINSLAFTFATWTLRLPVKPVSQDDKTATDVARTIQYFAQSLRNIVELDFCRLVSKSAGEYLYTNLATLYGGRLRALRAQGFVLLPIACLSRNVKVLGLTLDSSTVPVLPSICGETLKVLKLSSVPRNFAWHHFRYDIFDLPIVFHQLTVLHLSYERNDTPLTESEVQDKIAAGARCCDQLYFPALRELAIRNCTPDCDLLYADTPFPELKKVVLSGSIGSIRHCSRLRFTRVRDLSVHILPAESDDTVEIYKVTNHFFSNIRISRVASLSLGGDWFVLDPEAIRWINLTKLKVYKADYATVYMTIGRLPNLCELTIHTLDLGSFAGDSSLSISADPMLAWGERLTVLIIQYLDKDCPLIAGINVIQALIRRAVALEKLEVPRLVSQHVVRFIDMSKDRYSHLANITVL
ncbi:hypothetical protein GGI16_005408 [Coemansia sp. S142-1]|nr:hypothetical protein LPJ71_002716 [Coemansia sp. S17]KAJ2094836.1 hypothetical protein GGI16_005408 [Coemansia sp. S142-1]